MHRTRRRCRRWFLRDVADCELVKHLFDPWKIINAAYATKRGEADATSFGIRVSDPWRTLGAFESRVSAATAGHIADAVEYLWYLGHYLCVEGSVIGTSSASLILAHTAGAWLSTIGALCKYRLQPHQLRVQLAEPPTEVEWREKGAAEKGASMHDLKSVCAYPLRIVNVVV